MSQAESRALQDGANDHDRRAQEDHFPPAEDITNKDGDNSTNEAADVVTGDWYALNCCNMVVSGMVHCINFWKLSNPTSKSQETAHNTLIITEEAVQLLANAQAIWNIDMESTPRNAEMYHIISLGGRLNWYREWPISSEVSQMLLFVGDGML